MKSIDLIRDLSNAFGPSGFEEEVIEVVKKYTAEFDVEIDSLKNCYIKQKNIDKTKPTVMLDAHLDEVGFIVQSINGKGLINFLPLGGFIPSNIPAHLVSIRTDDKLVTAITTSKPPHFMTQKERDKKLELSDILMDVGALSREETLNMYGIDIANPIVPKVEFEYNEQTDIMLGKAFDNRLGCGCVIETLKALKDLELNVNVVGALASQEEVGTRGAIVTARTINPNIAIVFEGSPADDAFRDEFEAQGVLGNGPQIRHLDRSYISNSNLAKLAIKLAKRKWSKISECCKTCWWYQCRGDTC